MTNESQGARNVRIKANIVTKPDSTFPIVIQPTKIEFAESDSTAVVEFTITNRATSAIAPKIVSAPRSLVSITLPALIPASGSATGSVRLKRAGLKESFEKSVTVQLNDKQKSRFTIPIKRAGIAVAVPIDGGH